MSFPLANLMRAHAFTGNWDAVDRTLELAKQRDLREFVGDQYSGVEQEVLSDSLKYWEGRFHTITLEDRNLPVIAERRLLRPKDEGARLRIDQAFAETEKMREEAFQILLFNLVNAEQKQEIRDSVTVLRDGQRVELEVVPGSRE